MKNSIIIISVYLNLLFISNLSIAQKNKIQQNKELEKKTSTELNGIKLETVPFTPLIKIEPYQLTNLEKSALNQFISFCKIIIDVENGNRNPTNYPIMIIEALLDGKHPTITKSEIKSKLEEVNTNADLRYKFLTYFTSLIGEETSNLYFILRPVESDTRFVSRISKTDAEILSNMMLSHFYSKTFKEVEYTEKPEIQEKPEVFTFVDIESEYTGGISQMSSFIRKNLILPSKPNSTDLGYSSTKIYLSFIVNADGSLSNFEVMRRKEELKPYEDAVIECFKKMPRWKPAESKGKKVATLTTQTVNILLED